MEHVFGLIALLLLAYGGYAEYKHIKHSKLIESRKKEVAELYKFLRKDECV